MPLSLVRQFTPVVEPSLTLSVDLTTPAGGGAAGNYLAVFWLHSSSGGAQQCTDDRGNTYAEAISLSMADIDAGGGAAISAPLECGIFVSRLGTALQANDLVTVTHGVGGAWAVGAAEFSGVAVQDALDSTAADSIGPPTPAIPDTAPDSGLCAATEQAEELLLGLVAGYRTSPGALSLTPGSGWSALDGADVSDQYYLLPMWRTVSEAGQYRADGTLSSAAGWVALLAAYRAGGPLPEMPSLSGRSAIPSLSGRAVSPSLSGRSVGVSISGRVR